MRVNVYAEEMTDRVEIITKTIDGQDFTGLRIYLELPVTKWSDNDGYGHVAEQVQGPFIHRDGDDDSSAVTFWGKRDLREVLKKALAMLDEHYGSWSKDLYDRWTHTNGAAVLWSERAQSYACFGPGSMTAVTPEPFTHKTLLEEALRVAENGPGKEQS